MANLSQTTDHCHPGKPTKQSTPTDYTSSFSPTETSPPPALLGIKSPKPEEFGTKIAVERHIVNLGHESSLHVPLPPPQLPPPQWPSPMNSFHKPLTSHQQKREPHSADRELKHTSPPLSQVSAPSLHALNRPRTRKRNKCTFASSAAATSTMAGPASFRAKFSRY